jgi:cell volume regulation protein A
VTRDVILTVSLLFIGGLTARFVADLIHIPEMLVLLAVGALLGPSLLDVIDVPFDSLGAQLIFTLGVSAILFHGGLNLSLPLMRKVALSLGLLAIPGVFITAGVVGVAAHVVFDFSWTESLLIGAVLSPTDPAILIPLFLKSRLRPKVAQTVIAESAFNDPTGAVLALAFAGVLISGENSLSGPAQDFIVNLGISTVLGILAGIVLSAAISSRRAGIWSESSSIAVLTVVSIGYFSLDSAGGSGYLGAFIAGIIVGNMEILGLAMKPDHENEMTSFAGTLADIVTLFVFLVLGSNLPFGAIWDEMLPALAVLATLLFVARPITVLVCTLPDRGALWTRNELVFMCWTRETGVVPAALVGVLAGLGVPNNEVFASVVALAIIVTLTAQALPAGWIARRLGLLEPAPT